MSGINILYVENHKAFADAVIREFLVGDTVKVVSSLLEAKQQHLTTYDVILCDYDLDDGKGEAFVRWVREGKNNTPIIAVSSHNQGNNGLMIAGANAICKKTDFRNINDIITQVITLQTL